MVVGPKRQGWASPGRYARNEAGWRIPGDASDFSGGFGRLSKISSQGHGAARNPNAHDEIPDQRKRPCQSADEKQADRSVGQPGSVTPQVDVHGIEGGNAGSAKGHDGEKEFAGGNGKHRQQASHQTNGKPGLGGKGEWTLHINRVMPPRK